MKFFKHMMMVVKFIVFFQPVQSMYQKIKLILLAGSFAFLSACGGGGGGAPVTAAIVTSTETFQIRTALSNYLANTSTLVGSVSGTSSGYPVTGSFNVSQSAVTSGTFEGGSALLKATTATGSFIINGITVPSAITVVSYFNSNYVPLGTTGGTTYDVVTGAVTIPLTGIIGSNGIMYTENIYSSSSKTSLIGTTQTSFVIEPDTASTALFKLIQVERNNALVMTDTSTVTFRITPAGAITRLSESSTGGSTTLTIAY